MTPTLAEWLAFVEAHPHEFTIQYPPRREYFMQHFRRLPPPPVADWFGGTDELLLYLHVPFCEARCHYCNFAVDVSPSEQVHRQYVDALLRELDSHQSWLASRRVLGVDIGGGTPTRLPTTELKRLTQAIQPFLRHAAHPLPLSLETTPRIAADQPEKLQLLRAGGVGRVSLGVQSFNAKTLAAVNRRRQAEQMERALANLRAAHFPRVNFDIIFALPGQTLAEWRQDLQALIALAPDSVTTYDCLYRGPGRALTRRTTSWPQPQAYGAMYDCAFELLGQAGWSAPYGSVNFSRHPGETGTSAYFEGRLLEGQPYLGLGNYATSWGGNFWNFNAPSVPDYVARILARENPSAFFYDLPVAEAQAKYALFSLNYGFIDEQRFARRFGVGFEETYAPELRHAQEAGWLKHQDKRWQVNAGQFAHLYAIRSLFYSQPARRWLMALG